jgi:hypothetical protein
MKLADRNAGVVGEQGMEGQILLSLKPAAKGQLFMESNGGTPPYSQGYHP